MTTATVRNLRYDFPAILKQLAHGEEIAITLRGKLVGTLVPAEPKDPQIARWPDLTKRMKKVYGKRVFRAVDSILEQRKNER